MLTVKFNNSTFSPDVENNSKSSKEIANHEVAKKKKNEVHYFPIKGLSRKDFESTACRL